MSKVEAKQLPEKVAKSVISRDFILDETDLSSEEETWVKCYVDEGEGNGIAWFLEVPADCLKDILEHYGSDLQGYFNKILDKDEVPKDTKSSSEQKFDKYDLWNYARDVITDNQNEQFRFLTDKDEEDIEAAAEILYGLIHGKYLQIIRDFNNEEFPKQSGKEKTPKLFDDLAPRLLEAFMKYGETVRDGERVRAIGSALSDLLSLEMWLKKPKDKRDDEEKEISAIKKELQDALAQVKTSEGTGTMEELIRKLEPLKDTKSIMKLMREQEDETIQVGVTVAESFCEFIKKARPVETVKTLEVKFNNKEWGRCPRYYCYESGVIPYAPKKGQDEIIGGVKVKCPVCKGVYESPDENAEMIRGIFFGEYMYSILMKDTKDTGRERIEPTYTIYGFRLVEGEHRPGKCYFRAPKDINTV